MAKNRLAVAEKKGDKEDMRVIRVMREVDELMVRRINQAKNGVECGGPVGPGKKGKLGIE